MNEEKLKQRLIDRLQENYADYRTDLLTYDRQELIGRAGEISTISDVFHHLTEQQEYYGEEITHLLMFCNPLEVMCARYNEVAQKYDDYTFSEQMSLTKTENVADLKRYPLVTDSQPPEPLRKFLNVDIIASLKAIMGQVTVYHRSDFEYNMNAIQRAASAVEPEKKHLLWLCRHSGTHMHTERDVFIKGTASYNNVQFYHNDCQSEQVVLYSMEITGVKNGVIRGNLYERDRHQYAELAARGASPLKDETVIFESRSCISVPHEELDYEKQRDLAYDYGKIVEIRHEPEDESVVIGALWRERQRCDRLPKGKIQSHVGKLADNRIQAEADRIQGVFADLKEPNSPHKTHFIAAISPEFLLHASTQDSDRLFDKLHGMLKNDTMYFSTLKGEKGQFCFIKADPARTAEPPERKPSIKEQLAAPPTQGEKPATKPKEKEVR